MLIASDLRDLLKDNMVGVTTSEEACMRMGNTISEYVMDNAELVFSWVAVGPPPSSVPDPVIVAQGKVTFLNVMITPSGLTNPTLANQDLALQISTTTKSTGLFNINNTPENLFVTTPGSMSSMIDLILTPSGISDPDLAILDLCTKILNWFKTNTYTIPVTGTRAGVYTGTGLIISFQ